MIELRRLALLVSFALPSCSRAPEEEPAPSVAGSTVASPTPAPEAVAGVEGAWPEVPRGETASGAIWQTVRHGTIHVHLALPRGVEPVKSTLEYGHPVVKVRVGDSSVQITYSSGAAQFGPELARDPPTMASLPIERIARTPENTTILYRRGDQRVVLGMVRGAECKTEVLHAEDEDAAFAV